VGFINLVPSIYYNVLQYGATGNGSTDDTAAINAAITAAGNAGGGVVFLPDGTYKTSGILLLNQNNVTLAGAGWGTVIKPASGANFDVIGQVLPSVNAPNDVEGLVIQDLKIDGSNMSGTTAGQGNGIHFWGAFSPVIHHVRMTNIPNWCILLEGSTTSGYRAHISYCRLENGVAGIRTGSGFEVNFITNNSLVTGSGNCAALQPQYGSQSTDGYNMWLNTGSNMVTDNTFGHNFADVRASVLLQNTLQRLIGNHWDSPPYQALVIQGTRNLIIGNNIDHANNGQAVEMVTLQNSNNVIVGNSFDNDDQSSGHFTYDILESGGPYTGNMIADNWFRAGASGVISQNAGSTNKIHHNTGYNPVGSITAPAIPASTTAYTNSFGVDCMVIVSGGTVTVIAIGGVSTGLTSGAFRVPAGQTITLTYSSAPTWKWFGD